jgi:hypothetical protein
VNQNERWGGNWRALASPSSEFEGKSALRPPIRPTKFFGPTKPRHLDAVALLIKNAE